MSHWNSPQVSPSENVPANNDSTAPSHRWQSALRPLPASSEQEYEDHHRVVAYTSFYDEALMGANGGTTSSTPATNNGGQSGTEPHWNFPASQRYHQPGVEPAGHVPDQVYQFQQPGLLPADSNQHTSINPSQTILYTFASDSEPHHGGSVDQPQLRGESEYPPVYLTTDNLPGTQTPTGGLLLVPPAYNYAVNHPSSANNRFLDVLLQKGAHRLAYIFMDASSDMWIYTCDKVIGKDGPTEMLLDRIINNAGFRHMLKSPHLQAETCTITVHVPDRPGARQVIKKEVPADPKDTEFMRAFRNELRCVPDRVYEHLWKCSRILLQPSAQRRGIFSHEPGSPLDAKMHAKLTWAFEKNDMWGFGIFHEIIEDGDEFRPGRWFHNADFNEMLQEGMFDSTSRGWFGFIEATTNMDSSWKMTECPTAHLFAVAISWFIVTARCDFLRLRAVTVDWVSNTRIEEVKACTKFVEAWLLDFWRRSAGDAQTQSERAESIGFMLRHGICPLQAI